MVHIFPVLRIDTNIDHIDGHIMTCHSGHYGHFVEIGHYGVSQYDHKYGQYWCLCEEQEKCGLPVKAELKQAQLGVPHSRIQVELGFILQDVTCQILNFA